MWQNVDDLVSPMESVACVAKPIVDVVSSYPIINFSNVNKHFLSNLPEPARAFPHSWLLSRSRPKLRWTNPKHDEKYPCGIAIGFRNQSWDWWLAQQVPYMATSGMATNGSSKPRGPRIERSSTRRVRATPTSRRSSRGLSSSHADVVTIHIAMLLLQIVLISCISSW